MFDAPLQETSVVSGEKMSDVYVKGWLQGTNYVQKTDIHYRFVGWRLNIVLCHPPKHSWKTSTSQTPPLVFIPVYTSLLIPNRAFTNKKTTQYFSCNICRLDSETY